MKNVNQLPPESAGSEFGRGDSIKNLVMQEAAAAIMAAGRELTEMDRVSIKEFLRGPALRVGIALSVMGVTMWIAQINEEHKNKKAHGSNTGHPRARRSRTTAEHSG